jgi:hypothetical protein
MKAETKSQKVENPSADVVYKQAEEWEAKFSENNNRGKEMIKFISCGEQWDAGVTQKRRNSGKESLTLNVCRKELKKLLAQNSEIEFSLDVHPTTRESQDNVEESHAFSLLLSNIVLEKHIRENVTETFDKSAHYGYSFGEVSYCRKGNDDLSLYPTYITHKDPSTGFWDMNAALPTKVDGKFCGIKKMLNRCELMEKIPKISKTKCKVKEKDNEVIKYFFRQECDAEFRLLMNGKYKRVDLLTCEDENNFMTRERLSELMESGDIDEDFELVKTGKIDKIFYKMVCNRTDVFSPIEYPTYDLPLPFHGAFSVWTPDHHTFTIPYGYELKGAQKLFNFINSQIATQSKNSSSTKWFFKPEHVKTPEQIEAAKEINQKEGGLVFGGDTSTIIEKPPAQLSQTLIQMSMGLKQVMDEINGVSWIADAQSTVLSGEALDKITKNMRVMNEKALAVHVDYFNTVGKLFGQMIPQIITEERTIVIKKMDGTSDAMVVNEWTGTGTLKNNIKDLRNKFDYEIKAGPNETMQKQNTVRYLTQAYQISPNLLQDTADIYFRNLDCKDSGELSRRAAAKIDPTLIQYSQGEITKKVYDEAQQAKAKQQQELQKQAVLNDPTYQATLAATSAEHRKADAFQKDADTKRIKEVGTLINNDQKNEIALAEVLLKAHQGDTKHIIDLTQKSMELNSDMVDKMRDVIGDSDMPLQGATEPGAANVQGGENPIPSQNEGEPNAG